MTRSLPALLGLALALAVAAPAPASWSTGGTGTGVARTADMPTGATPIVVVTGRSIQVTWAQNAFAGGTIGSRGGGYTLTRYAEASTAPVAPGAGCSGIRTGAGDPQSCTETGVPYGRWVYRVTPVLNSFTGTQGPPSSVAAVVLAAPVLTSVKAQNPAAGATNGPIAVSWTASAGATGYNVYRRLTGGSYDVGAPLNGAQPLTATSFSDTTASGGATYEYVVRAVASSPVTTSEPSNQLSAKVITRPPAPAGAVSAVRGASGAIDVSWAAVAAAEGYNVYRRTTLGTFDYTKPLNGTVPLAATTFRDTTAATGTTYVYVIRSAVTGADAVQVESADSAASTPVGCASTYSATITADGPSTYFRLADLTALLAINQVSALRSGTYGGGVTFGQPGAISCDTNTAVSFNGTSGYLGAAALTGAVEAPDTVSLEVWFKTTTSRGGKLLGFGDARTGASGQYDRHLYLTDAGNVTFGVTLGRARTITSPAAYNDGQWHMALAELGEEGMKLYLDGSEVAADAQTKKGGAYRGFWRAGYDSLDGWPEAPTSSFFAGSLDEIAIYPTELSAARGAAHYAAGRP